MTVCSRQTELCRHREQRGEFSWSSGQEVEARELHRKGDTMESKISSCSNWSFWCSVFAFSFTLDIPWEVYSWPRFSHCCLALRLPYSSFTVTGACGFGMIPFTSPGIVCQSLQKVIVCVLKYTACAFLHFFF